MPRLSAVAVLFAVTMLVLGIHDLTRGLTAASLVAPVDAAAAADAPDTAVPDAETDTEPTAEPDAEGPSGSGGLTTDQLDIGTVVTTTEGATLYRFDKDGARPSRSVCNNQCAAMWPPLWATHGIPALDGIDPTLVGTVTRDDGNKQVTLAGWPLYRYAQDSPGEAEGNGFGGTWHAMEPGGGTVVAPVEELAPGPAPGVAPRPAPRRLAKIAPPKPVKKQSDKKKDEKKQSSRGSH